MTRGAIFGRRHSSRPFAGALLATALACCIASVSAANGVTIKRSAGVAGPRSARAQVDQVDRAYHRAVARRDLNAVADLYARSANLVASKSPPVHGRAAIRRYLIGVFKAGWCAFTFRPSAVQASGSMVVAFGHYVSSLCVGRRVVTSPRRWAVLTFTPRAGGGLQISYDIFIG